MMRLQRFLLNVINDSYYLQSIYYCSNKRKHKILVISTSYLNLELNKLALLLSAELVLTNVQKPD
jgi:hypothetical protein